MPDEKTPPTAHRSPPTGEGGVEGPKWQGIYAVLQTPLTDDDRIDNDILAKQVAFCLECGAHGLVFPVLGGEFQYLTETERREGLEIVIDAAAKRVPVVAGVAGPSAAVACELARAAGKAGADAIIAMPPYIAPAKQDELFSYFSSIASAGRLPVFIQHSRIAPMQPAFLVRLLKEIDEVEVIKEEREPSAHNITEVAGNVGNACRGIFGGAHGKWMVSEMRRGATGFMPAAQTIEVYVRIWQAFQEGDEAEARRVFNAHLPLINFIQLLGLRACKEVLVHRGIFTNSRMRAPGAMELDDDDRRELGLILDDLAPYLRPADA